MRNLLLGAALALPTAAWAGHGGHGGHSHGGASGFHHPGFHHRHSHSSFAFVGVSPFFFGPPSYYGPAYAQPAPPITYIEKFPGTPSAGMTDIVCPGSGARYPEVGECPGGWARVIENPRTAPPG